MAAEPKDGPGVVTADLTEAQSRPIGRIQLIGVILIVCSTTVAGLVRTAPVVLASLCVMVVGILVLGWLAARVQRRPFRETAREANRAVVDELHEKRTEWSHRLGHSD